MDLRASTKASSFTESVIREMTRLAHEHGSINLGQGMPDFAAPEEVKEAARRAIAEDHNQYPITWGVPEFRDAIAASYAANYGLSIDPDSEVCVTCGSTEAMVASFLGVLDPEDEVVVFEPYYENKGHFSPSRSGRCLTVGASSPARIRPRLPRRGSAPQLHMPTSHRLLLPQRMSHPSSRPRLRLRDSRS